MSNSMSTMPKDTRSSKKTISVFFLLDHSGSMEEDGRILRLNDAIPATIEVLKGVRRAYPNLSIKIKVIKFSTKAVFHAGGSSGTYIENLKWIPLETDKYTATAKAINLLCDQLDFEKMHRHELHSICVLVSDGYCTDSESEYMAAIDRLNRDPFGQMASRIVISIGNDIDQNSLKLFTNEFGSYTNCENASEIVEQIRRKTTDVAIALTETMRAVDKGYSSDASNEDGINRYARFDTID